MKPIQLLPAVDVIAGRAVQLVQGVAETKQDFGDPIELALQWQQQGATWLHVVDLDAAFGRGNNVEVIKRLVDAVGISVEVSGGIRDEVAAERALAAGATRLNLGTAAIENPLWTAQLLARYPEQIAIGLDVRGEVLASRGWTMSAGPWREAVQRLSEAGCRRFVVTDVQADGTLTGPNLQLLQQVGQATSAAIVASGGVSSLADIAALRELDRIEGVIIGTALYTNSFTLTDALKIAGGSNA
ncbi:MAG: bifunctional 1-(5-phosphoribosyl)-5-((5-phosphoribosylamino)methylideneamino)imidazole-4-carboxamide isomerase/phosphoribosylanthranilate isomerase PriA [Arachnia propionica]|nr:MAG: bifunctional 1-(5-phosphoribosyl)-5-((5-phosphoribosylamino)methylideneamino)imidazole-4-carboxamide isomerase/phosphoribosylanthranilate isomerase PriA [Arachnia propionica]